MLQACVFNELRQRGRMGRFGTGLARLCAVAAAETAARMAKHVSRALRETPTVELRLDWLKNDRERQRLLRWLGKNHRPGGQLIATCRRRIGGGRFAGSARTELRWLRLAGEAGCQWCDVEVETLRELPGRSLRGRGLPKVLLSVHDFRRTPALRGVISQAACREADAVKVAMRVRSIADSLRLLRFARRSRNTVVVPMGQVGLPARLLALREGSQLAYAPMDGATAPGQVSLHDSKHLYRAQELTRQTRVFGVIGNPIEHSLSPVLHNSGFMARGIDAVYLPFLVRDLADFLKAVPELGIRGFSVTLPHKAAILKHLQECDALADDIGAVNTVTVRRDGALYGSNTDYRGVLEALEKRVRLRGSRVLIFGAGGSARAAAFALARAGASVSICARREHAARQLARAVGGESLPRRSLASQWFDALLNTTPVGMFPHAAISPLSARELNCRIVMDLIYRPEETLLLKLARQKGLATLSGVDMFLAQGIAQWELWMKRRAPRAAMRRAVLAALGKESHGGLSGPPSRVGAE